MWPWFPIRGFKLAISTFVLSTLDVYLHSHIPQALHFYYDFKHDLTRVDLCTQKQVSQSMAIFSRASCPRL